MPLTKKSPEDAGGVGEELVVTKSDQRTDSRTESRRQVQHRSPRNEHFRAVVTYEEIDGLEFVHGRVRHVASMGLPMVSDFKPRDLLRKQRELDPVLFLPG